MTAVSQPSFFYHLRLCFNKTLFISSQVPIPDTNTLIQNGSHVANYTGLQYTTFESNLWPQYGKDYTAHGSLVNFASVFGVLFSGVTGIMAGANMSGKFK